MITFYHIKIFSKISIITGEREDLKMVQSYSVNFGDAMNVPLRIPMRFSEIDMKETRR